MTELKDWVAAPSPYWGQGKEHFCSCGLSTTEDKIHQEHREGRRSEFTFIVLVLTPLVSFLLSLCFTLSFLPSSLSFPVYSLLYTFNTQDDMHAAILYPKTTRATGDDHRASGMSAGRSESLRVWLHGGGWSSPSKYLSWYVFLLHVISLASWSYQQGIKLCSVDLKHEIYVSIFLPMDILFLH